VAHEHTSPEGPRAIIELHRFSARHDRYRRYVVMVDGRRVGTIRDGETREFQVSPGPHTVRLRLDWPWRSQTLDIDCSQALRTVLACRPSSGLAIVVATLCFMRYIDLSEK
jgi:hypothetical protein